MILTDGRGVAHDIGPGQAVGPSYVEFEAVKPIPEAPDKFVSDWRKTNNMLFARQEPRVRRLRAPRINAKAPKPERDTCRPGRHPRPEKGTRCPACKAEAFARWSAKSGRTKR